MKYARIEGDIAYIELTNGKEAIIDVVDVIEVSRFSWCAVEMRKGQGKVKTYARSGRVGYMHRWLKKAPKGMDVDHIDDNGLNNRQGNLRIVTRSQNMQNRVGANCNSITGVRGVHIHRQRARKRVSYNARYMVMGKTHTKNFPFTEKGKKEATAWVIKKRKEFMTHSDS